MQMTKLVMPVNNPRPHPVLRHYTLHREKTSPMCSLSVPHHERDSHSSEAQGDRRQLRAVSVPLGSFSCTHQGREMEPDRLAPAPRSPLAFTPRLPHSEMSAKQSISHWPLSWGHHQPFSPVTFCVPASASATPGTGWLGH